MRNTLMAVVATGAMAAATSAFGQAVIIEDFACTVLDAEGKGWAIDGQTQAVITSPDGNTKLTCNGELGDDATLPGEVPSSGGDPLPNHAVVHDFESTYDGPGTGLCFTFLGATDDWHSVVTKSGRAILTCHVNGQP